MKNALVIVTLSSLLTACAGLAPQTGVAPGSDSRASVDMPTGTAAIKQGKNSDRGSVEPVEDALPAAELTDDLLFRLLSAEIAFQRGDWQNAYVTELSAAQQTRDPRLARRAAEIALSAKQAGEAMSAVRLWRELAPTSAEATQYYLGFVLLSDNLEEARSILAQRLAEARPAMRPIMILQTQRLLANAKSKDAAFSLLESLVAPYSSLAESHIALALNAFLKNDAVRANSEARAALAIKPDSEMAILTLAQVTPDPAEGARILTSYLATYPKATEVRTAFARSLVEQKKYDLARTEFEKLLAQQPGNLTSLYALGMLGIQTNHLPEAEQYLTRYLKALAAAPDEDRDPNQALLVLAQIAEDRNDTEAALNWLAQVDSGEGVLNAQIKRAQIVAKRGNLAEGQKILREISADSEREQTQVTLAEAQILRDANQAAQAFKVLGDALKRYPDNTDLLYDYAMVAEKANNLDVMEKALRRVMELAPTNQNAYNALGYSFAERNIRLPEAYALVEKALTIAPDDPFIMDSLGWVQFRLGKLKESEDLLRRAYAARPDPEIAVHLGEVLWVKGQKDDAQKLWRDANTRDPKNDTLKSTLARLRVSL
ncbi:MAG: tetratricopeptide repeat protein [Herminiimonas sp.]|nr:tetratricopeptide repeat protein [Herminiimonas sp.]